MNYDIQSFMHVIGTRIDRVFDKLAQRGTRVAKRPHHTAFLPHQERHEYRTYRSPLKTSARDSSGLVGFFTFGIEKGYSYLHKLYALRNFVRLKWTPMMTLL
jgi:hypothetical protein